MIDYDELFDDPDEYEDDELDGFSIISVVPIDNESVVGYTEYSAIPCLLGYGNDEGYCIRDKYSCHLEGCEHATPN